MELRQLWQDDVERMENDRASVIETQRIRIDDLEKQHKEEREIRQQLESVIGNLREHVPKKETFNAEITVLQNKIDELKKALQGQSHRSFLSSHRTMPTVRRRLRRR